MFKWGWDLFFDSANTVCLQMSAVWLVIDPVLVVSHMPPFAILFSDIIVRLSCYFPFGSSIGMGPRLPDIEIYGYVAGYPIQWKRNTKYKHDETRTSTEAERVHVLIYMYLDHWNLTCWIYIWWCPPKGAGYPELDLLVVVDTPAGAPAQTQHRDTILPGPCASLGVHIPLTTMQATALSVCLSTKVL